MLCPQYGGRGGGTRLRAAPPRHGFRQDLTVWYLLDFDPVR